ncbi:MAG: hypothetical protein Q9195_004681 [Heterodermia aff. obscurata]
MTNNPALGLLASLPVELRLQIWKYLSLNHDEIKDGGKSPSQKLAILYTSRQINHEASAIIYANIDLHFTIEPHYDRKSWLRISTNLGTAYALHDTADAVHRGFDKLPYQNLHGIHISIQAPNPRDPGQIVNLFKKSTHLVTLLQPSRLPPLIIQLSNTPTTKWTHPTTHQPLKSVARDRPKRHPIVDPILDRTTDEAFITCDDSRLALCAFLPLRNARSAHILTPPDMQRQEPFLSNLIEVWTDEGPFGTWLDPTYEWNDTKLQERVDIVFTDLDLELDMLPGATADMLRLERFAEWYGEGWGESAYEREYERILKSWTERKYWRDIKAEKLNWRYGIMRALNPGSLYC